MTTLVKILILFLMTIFLSSCMFGPGIMGNGDVVTENRDTDQKFTQISAQEGIMVYVSQAKEYSIEVEADENIIDLIGTDINDGQLKIHAIENIGHATKKVYVSLPNITALKSSSGAHLNTENKIKTNELVVDGDSDNPIITTIIPNWGEFSLNAADNITTDFKYTTTH